MTEPCKNMCSDPVTFPRSIRNRPGLPHIDFRIGGYSDFLEAMLRSMDHQENLQNWTHREGDDPGIALLEGASVLGDILTFYQELYANEAFLRTAQWRETIGDLVRLVGYRLSPGLGGSASFAVEIKNGNPVVIPPGFQLKAQLDGFEKKMEFETDSEITAYPELSTLTLYRPSSIPSFPGRVREFSLKTATLELSETELKEGDSLMILDTTSQSTTNTQIVVVKEVREHLGRTNITIEGYWEKGNGLSSVQVFKLGRNFRHFGYNASQEIVEVESGMATQHSITYDRNVGSTTSSTGYTTIQPSIGSDEIPLDSEAENIATGSKLIIQGIGGDEHTVVRTVMGSRKTTVTWGAQTGGSTIMTIDRNIGQTGGSTKKTGDRNVVQTGGSSKKSSDRNVVQIGGSSKKSSDWNAVQIRGITLKTDIRDLVMYETIGSSVIMYPVRTIESGADGSRLDVFTDSETYQRLDGRTLVLLMEDGSTMETTVTIDQDEIDDNDERLRPLFLSAPVTGSLNLGDFPLEDPTVTVYGNVITTTQGKSEDEAVLGNGDSRQSFQSFKLPKSPLTYLNNADDDPPESPELHVYVEETQWERVPSLFNSGPDDEVYIVREDEEGNSWVQFGDGNTGKRLPSGIKNVKARFRTGTGAYGPLKEETTVQAGSKLKGVDKIHLPGTVSGGCEAENGENAREAAPGKIQSLDRLVSLRDFETEVLGIAGVSKAKGRWELVDNVPSIVLTVLMDTGRDKEVDQVRATMASYNKSRGPQRFPIIVVPGSRKNIYLDITFGLHPSYQEDLIKEDIMNALGVSAGDDEGESTSGTGGTSGGSGNGGGGSGDSGGGSGSDPWGVKALLMEPQRQFGQPEYATRIAGIIQNVEGVVWAEVKALGTLEPPTTSSSSSTTTTSQYMLRPLRKRLQGNRTQAERFHRVRSTKQGVPERGMLKRDYVKAPAKLFIPMRKTDRLTTRGPRPDFLTKRLPLHRPPVSERVIICDPRQILTLDHEDLTMNAVSTSDMEVYPDE